MSKLTEKQRNLKQIPFRLHENDHKAFKSKCITDNLKMQNIVEACVLAYLNGDQHIKTLAVEHKSLNTVTKRKASWSGRESENLLSEIESIGGEDE